MIFLERPRISSCSSDEAVSTSLVKIQFVQYRGVLPYLGILANLFATKLALRG